MPPPTTSTSQACGVRESAGGAATGAALAAVEINLSPRGPNETLTTENVQAELLFVLVRFEFVCLLLFSFLS